MNVTLILSFKKFKKFYSEQLDITKMESEDIR